MTSGSVASIGNPVTKFAKFIFCYNDSLYFILPSRKKSKKHRLPSYPTQKMPYQTKINGDSLY